MSWRGLLSDVFACLLSLYQVLHRADIHAWLAERHADLGSSEAEATHALALDARLPARSFASSRCRPRDVVRPLACPRASALVGLLRSAGWTVEEARETRCPW